MNAFGRLKRMQLIPACLAASALIGCVAETESPSEFRNAAADPAAPAVGGIVGNREQSIEAMIQSALAELESGEVEPLTDPNGDSSPELTMASPDEIGSTDDAARQSQIESVSNQRVPANGVDSGLASAVADQGGNRSGRLSEEQDFEVVSDRESIESDALRRQVQQGRLVVFEPTELPARQGMSNVAEYAFSVSHAVGEQIYPRNWVLFGKSIYWERCQSYPDSEMAQLEFLDAGGPAKDSLNIDPDGDGFACGWTPELYRSLLQQAPSQ